MSTTRRSFAKINLHLEVVGRRADGYHQLRTVFQTVSLCDHIAVSLGGRAVELSVKGYPVPTGAGNLAHRAASEFLARWGGARGVEIELDKRIPVAAGLGGGSSNAATVLLALRELVGAPAEVEDLVAVAASLGSDVPYFLYGGTAYGSGRGDRVRRLVDFAEQELWLIHPGVPVSTADVFGCGHLVYRQEPHPHLDALLSGGFTEAAEAVGINDLEAAVLGLYGPVKEVYTALVQTGAEGVRVSGSGATLFAFRVSAADGFDPVACLPRNASVIEARTLSRASIAASRVVDSLEGS